MQDLNNYPQGQGLWAVGELGWHAGKYYSELKLYTSYIDVTPLAIKLSNSNNGVVMCSVPLCTTGWVFYSHYYHHYDIPVFVIARYCPPCTVHKHQVCGLHIILIDSKVMASLISRIQIVCVGWNCTNETMRYSFCTKSYPTSTNESTPSLTNVINHRRVIQYTEILCVNHT